MIIQTFQHHQLHLHNANVYCYKNTGKLGKPNFEKHECILETLDIDDKAYMIGSCQVSITDYNNDGKKDGTDKYLKNRRDAIGKAIAKKRGRVKEGFSAWRIDLDFNEQVKK